MKPRRERRRRHGGLWVGAPWPLGEYSSRSNGIIIGDTNSSSFLYFGVCIARIIPVSRKVRTQYGGSSNLVKQGNRGLDYLPRGYVLSYFAYLNLGFMSLFSYAWT